MDTRKLKHTAGNLARKHGPKLERGVAGAERFAMKRAKGREAKVQGAANAARSFLRKQQRPH